MENKFKFIVYQTINIINNKIYIGVHKTRDPNVFDSYLGCGVKSTCPSTYMNPKNPFQYAVKKYGPSSFKRSVLYIFDNEEQAYEMEETLVTSEFIRRSDTYNACLGGKLLRKLGSHIYQFDRKGNLVKKWEDIYEAADFLDTWKESIYSAIHNKSRLYGSYWAYTPQIAVGEYSSPNECRHVYKYNEDGKCVAIYKSIGEAARIEKVQPGHIILRVKTGGLSEEKYYFSYKLYDKYILRPRLDLKDAYIFLYDLDGNFKEKIYTKEFKKKYGVKSYKEISDCILNKGSLKGHQIRSTFYEKLSKYFPKNKKRAVIIYTLAGELVGEYESVTSACRDLKLDSSTVSKILRGCAKSTKGYTIKYKTEDIV